MRKRKRTYPPPRTGGQPARRGEAAPIRPSLVTIDLTARTGGGDFAIGERVRISGTGLYAGEIAVVEARAGSAIPSVLVRTAAGSTRRVRTIDIERLAPGEPPG